jgi:hypothetical protein
MEDDSCATLPSSAVGWWPGEGDASDRFARSPGTPQRGVSWANGEVGQAFSFTAISQQAVEIPSSALVTSSFSVEAWVNPASQLGGSGQAFIFGQSYGRQLIVRNDGYNPNGLIVAWAVSNSRWPFYEVDSTTDAPIGQWTHLVGTWDQTTLTLKLYINGALNQSAPLNITPWDSGCPCHIGGVYDSSGDCSYIGQFFNGLIDEVTYYNQALSAADVSSLYIAGAAGKCFTYTLAYHMATNAVGHALGYANISLAEQSVVYNPPIWYPGCWLHGVVGLSATSIGCSNGPPPLPGQDPIVYGYPVVTMVSPRHFLFAQHTYPEGNPIRAFLGTDNVVRYARMLDRADLLPENDPSNADISVGILDTDLPPSVGYVPVLPPDYSTYLPTGSEDFVQGIGMRSDEYAMLFVFSEPIVLNDPSFPQLFVDWNPAKAIIPLGFGLGTEWSLPIVISDSSCPLRFLINNQLVLVSAAYEFTYGPNYAKFIADINQAMYHLSTNNSAPVYQLTTYSLTGWPHVQ